MLMPHIVFTLQQVICSKPSTQHKSVSHGAWGRVFL